MALIHILLLHLSFIFLVLDASDVEHIVAPDKDLAKVSCESSVDEFFSVSELQIHVTIYRYEISFVLHAPLKFHHNGFPSERVEERLGVHGKGSHVDVFFLHLTWKDIGDRVILALHFNNGVYSGF